MELELGPLQPDPGQLALGLALLFLMMGALGLGIIPRIERVRAERWEATEGRAERAEAVRAEAEAVQDAARRQLADARHEAARIRQEYAAQGAAAIEAAREEAVRDRDRLVAAAHAQLAASGELAAVRLRHDVGELAVDLAGRVVGESVGAIAARRGTVDRFFAER
ncbi:F0F1 ATP synthase subunit B family protein [Kitasatospora sp. NPDC001660]